MTTSRCTDGAAGALQLVRELATRADELGAELAAAVAAARELRGVDDCAIATALGVHRNTVSRRYGSTRPPRPREPRRPVRSAPAIAPSAREKPIEPPWVAEALARNAARRQARQQAGL